MSKAKHTPGPWTVEKRTKAQYDPDSGERRKDRVDLFINASDGAVAVAANSTFIPGAEANARLIAAAPELLEALGRFAQMSTRPEYSEELNNAIIDARSAVAKARGGD